jgi:hypothetical protein
MAFTHKVVTEWMDRYFQTFAKCAQDPPNMYRMGEFFAQDLEFIQYYPDTPHILGLDNFHKLNVHPEVHETLTPKFYVIDTEKKMVAALINVVVKNTRTGEILLTPTYCALYNFKQYEDGSFKIVKIQLFNEHSDKYAAFIATLPKG